VYLVYGLGDVSTVKDRNDKELLICPKANDCSRGDCPHRKPHEEDVYCINSTCGIIGYNKIIKDVSCIKHLIDWDS